MRRETHFQNRVERDASRCGNPLAQGLRLLTPLRLALFTAAVIAMTDAPAHARSAIGSSDMDIFDIQLPSSVTFSGGADSESTRQGSADFVFNLHSGWQVVGGIDRYRYNDEGEVSQSTGMRFGLSSDPLDVWSWSGEFDASNEDGASFSRTLIARVSYAPTNVSWSSEVLFHRYHLPDGDISSPALRLGFLWSLPASWTVGFEVYRAGFSEDMSRYQTDETLANTLTRASLDGAMVASSWLKDQATLSLGKSLRHFSLTSDLSVGHTAVDSKRVASVALSPSYEFSRTWSAGARLQVTRNPDGAANTRAVMLRFSYSWY